MLAKEALKKVNTETNNRIKADSLILHELYRVDKSLREMVKIYLRLDEELEKLKKMLEDHKSDRHIHTSMRNYDEFAL